MTDKSKKSRGLGRGLSALMADVQDEAARDDAPTTPADQNVPIEALSPNPDQPRRTFEEAALEELAQSIKERGIIQPIIVRSKGDGYEIVAGERRWRAAQRAQVHRVPVVVRDLSDAEVLEIAIIENIQRADLNAIDEAAGYQQLMDRFGHTQEQLGTALGKSRSHIANLLRLLTLPEAVRDHVVQGRLSAGHARALVGQENAADLARQIIRGGLSVRATEALVKQGATGKAPKASSGGETGGGTGKDADTVQIERELAAHLAMKVDINHKPGGENGTLSLYYKDLAQLDDLLRRLSAG